MKLGCHLSLTHAHTRAHTHTRTHAHAHTHTHTRTHTRTHTHTHSCLCSLLQLILLSVWSSSIQATIFPSHPGMMASSWNTYTPGNPWACIRQAGRSASR